MSKRGILIAFFALIILVKFVGAQTTDYTEKTNKAFKCLEDEIRKTPTLTLQQAAFSMLAGAGGTRVNTAVQDFKSSNTNCWPKEGCKIKDTAQVALAYKKQNRNNDAIISWLKNQTSTPKDLTWYLSIIIEENKPANCIVSYDGANYDANIGSDGFTITAPNGLGNCLSLGPDSRLTISSACVEKEFGISCSKSTDDFSKFKTSFSAVNNGGYTYLISPDTKSSGPGEKHIMKISVKCFKKDLTSGGCDYESSLWATTALDNKGEDVSSYVPYLKVVRELNDNEKYFPEAFLINLATRDEFFPAIIDKRINARWDIPGSPYSSFYDTALGIIALGGIGGAETASTVADLFATGSQTEQGCWNNNDVTDTAFLLYSLGVGRTSSGGGGNPIELPGGNNSENITNGSGGVTPGPTTDCESAGLYCATNSIDCLSAGGFIEDTYNCAIFSDKCCTVKVENIETCTDKGGKICRQNEKCSSSVVETSDGACCLGICQGTEIENGGNNTYVPPATKSSGTNWWLIIIILAVLILIVVLGIIYRNKIRLLWLTRRGKAKSSKLPPGPPSGMGAPSFRPGPPRFGPPPTRPIVQQGPQIRQSAQNDREMDETLRKLKKISDS